MSYSQCAFCRIHFARMVFVPVGTRVKQLFSLLPGSFLIAALDSTSNLRNIALFLSFPSTFLKFFLRTLS